ncbi:hypothetical protein D6C85_08273 [Aureobasidium pullulans]|uniref:Uncharacterized protein n=1 Tax=Aureobasidium pullulans TaxID=5580 RepID=A0A4V4KWK4_AURPU|nr:hypothetical protein D6C85_08273 [Aureobasidium pullulans]
MSLTPKKLALNSSLLEQLQAQFPTNTPSDPSSPISKGIAALERRASNRSAASYKNMPGSPFERSRTASPMPARLNLTIDTTSGIRSTASSPGPMTGSRRIPPPLLKTRMRPPSELFLPTPGTSRSTGFRFSTIIAEESGADIVASLIVRTEPSTPATIASIPFFSSPPLSPASASIADAISRVDVGASVQNAIDNLSKPEANRFIFPPLRSSTAPPASISRQPSFISIKSTRSLPLRAFSTRLGRLSRAGGSSSRGAGVTPRLSRSPKRGLQFSGIDKDLASDRRVSMMIAKHKSNLESVLASPIEEQAPTRPVLKKAATSVMPWRRKRKGETMSMLLDSGFFPVQEFIYEKNDSSPSTTSPSKRKQLALSILVKDLPTERPSSILMTPTNFYQQGSLGLRRSTRSNQRRSMGPRRRILNAASVSSSQISPTMITHTSVMAPPLSPSSPTSPTSPLTPTKALAALTGSMLLPPSPGSDGSPKSGQPSPGILEVIPEDSGAVAHRVPSSASTISPRSSPEAPALPEAIASEIHLSSGTVLMVKTPETTAYRRSIYIQGPIKLPTPAVVPRKGSIATLDPFQDSLANAPIPRRKSEDMAADDICDWYDTWGFDSVSFALDEFTLDETDLTKDWALSPLEEEPESPVDRTVRFPSPAPPLAKEVAAAMMGNGVMRPESQAIKPRPLRMSMPMVPLPELPKTPSFMARDKGHSRNSSGETSYKSASSDPITRTDSRGSGMSNISSVEEKSWFDTDKSKRRGSGSAEPVKPKPKMSRMRRFVQTASAIL